MTSTSILKVIEHTHPEIVREVSAGLIPERTDLSQIRNLYELYRLKTCYHNPSDEFETKMLFVAVVLKLYSPAALIVHNSLKRGVSNQIATCFKSGRRNASYYISQARHYFRHVNSFRERVTKLSTDL